MLPDMFIYILLKLLLKVVTSKLAITLRQWRCVSSIGSTSLESSLPYLGHPILIEIEELLILLLFYLINNY